MSNREDIPCGYNDGPDHDDTFCEYSHGRLCEYDTTRVIRRATPEEQRRSIDAAEHDDGAGVITVDGVRCYVED